MRAHRTGLSDAKNDEVFEELDENRDRDVEVDGMLRADEPGKNTKNKLHIMYQNKI